ncbi:MAG: hypothetical protein VB876_05815 [Pirellulales bacterium]
MRLLRLATVFTVMIATASSASANPLAAFWRDFSRSYQRNRCWPHPFAEFDNFAARQPVALMIDNGWRLQNIIGTHHFETNQTILNEAGRRHIHWVLTQPPPHRRVVFVERGFTPEETAARMRDVLKVAQQFVAPGHPPPVQETHIVARGVSADYVNKINTKFKESTPDPRLENAAGSGGQE